MTRHKQLMLVAALVLSVCALLVSGFAVSGESTMNQTNTYEKATLAGGCFWCVEADMQRLPGVITVISGYAGGEEKHPSYNEVAKGLTGHREAVQVTFDPAQVSYEEVLAHFWKHFDPTDDSGSFGDRGFQYTSAIFYHNETQREIAETSKKSLDESGVLNGHVVTPVLPYTTFYEAEEYHQDFSEKSSTRYKSYRFFSGRDSFVKKTWGNRSCPLPPRRKAPTETQYAKPDDDTLREQLTPLQYDVTQKDGTEPAFNNEFWDNKREGIYVEAVTGEPLFASTDKFDSGTGWPSFTRPLAPDNVVEKEDTSLFMKRTEVRSKHGDSHLGHVFDDGPQPTGLRYCINSAALRFIPKEQLEAEGYGKYLKLFK